MNSKNWPAVFLDQLGVSGVPVETGTAPGLAPARLIRVRLEDWGRLGAEAKTAGCRWVAGFGEDTGEEILINACFEQAGVYLLARTAVPRATPVLYSHTPYFPGANRPERHLQDTYGVTFADHPDPRRWTRHQAWSEHDYPLRRDFPASGRHGGARTPADRHYKFLSAQGSGVYEIPVGPVHAGIIEPGHFRFLAVGETVLNLEERLGYVHKGIEKIAEGRDAAGLARLAARVSGDTTVGHAYCACLAMEKAAAIDVPPRAVALRAVMAERERIANHLGDIGAILNDVSFTFGFYQFGRLREQWQRTSQRVFEHRFMMDRIVPGGVTHDISTERRELMQSDIKALRAELTSLTAIYTDLPSVEDRLVTTGYLDPALVRAVGALGYVARASGVDFDVRRDAPYPPYDRLKVDVPIYKYGDVAARTRVRAEEILVSCNLLEQLLADLPDGSIANPWRAPADGAEGIAMIEGWRGEIVAYIRFGAGGRIARYFPRDPSVFNWPALELLIHDNIVPDFPVCNKSVNGSYSGNDL
jgi:Ni,Fe-hydrogenase III large subunit